MSESRPIQPPPGGDVAVKRDDSVPWFLIPFIAVGYIALVVGALLLSGIGGLVVWGGLYLMVSWITGLGSLGWIFATLAFWAVFVVIGLFTD